tara:strand:- start:966 stop:1520 length:555 start_codon:yes stop_codon:yes gene_type:complete
MSSFVEISTSTASNAGSVTLTGITSDYNTYALFYSDVVPADSDADLQCRFTQSNGSGGHTANDNSNYVLAIAYMRSDQSFISSQYNNLGLAGRNAIGLSGSADNSSTSGQTGVIYIFSASNSSDNTYLIANTNYLSSGGTQIMLGQNMGGILKEQTAVTGIQLFFLAPSSNISKGNFALYGLKE